MHFTLANKFDYLQISVVPPDVYVQKGEPHSLVVTQLAFKRFVAGVQCFVTQQRFQFRSFEVAILAQVLCAHVNRPHVLLDLMLMLTRVITQLTFERVVGALMHNELAFEIRCEITILTFHFQG